MLTLYWTVASSSILYSTASIVSDIRRAYPSYDFACNGPGKEQKCYIPDITLFIENLHVSFYPVDNRIQLKVQCTLKCLDFFFESDIFRATLQQLEEAPL